MLQAANALARWTAPGLFILLGACAPSDAVVARVGERSITSGQLDEQVQVFLTVRPGTQADNATRRLVLEQLIRQELLGAEARKDGAERDPAFREALSKRQAALRSELEEGIRRSQVQLKNLEQAVETRALIERLYESRGRALSITARELRQAYQERRAQPGPPPPPLSELSASLREQVALERLVQAIRQGVKVQVYEDRLGR